MFSYFFRKVYLIHENYYAALSQRTLIIILNECFSKHNTENLKKKLL